MNAAETEGGLLSAYPKTLKNAKLAKIENFRGVKIYDFDRIFGAHKIFNFMAVKIFTCPNTKCLNAF
jgi:hypothetical protein